MSDRFKNFHQLSSKYKEGDDFKIVYKEQGKNWLIMAPHGGKIEPMTSELAKKIAGDTHSLYCFEGLLKTYNGDLHITSTNFDEPIATELLKKVDKVFSVHGCTDENFKADINIGGLDYNLKSRLKEYLVRNRYNAAISSQTLKGEEKNNICNRGKLGIGLQIEIQRKFRNTLATNSNDLTKFTTVLKEFLELTT